MRKKVDIEPVKGWQGAVGLISTCSVCKTHLDGKSVVYWQRINTYEDGIKTRIACRGCADK